MDDGQDIEIDIREVVVSAQQPNGDVTVQVASLDGEAAEDTDLFAPGGMWSVPLEPVKDASGARDPEQTTKVLFIRIGAKSYSIPIGDGRELAVTANGKPGDRGWNGNSAASIKLGRDGAINLSTTSDNTPTGTTVSLRLAPDGLHITGPMGELHFDGASFRVRSAHGSRLRVGGVGGAEGAVVGNYVRATADTVRLEGAVAMGAPGPTQSVALAEAVCLAIQAVNAQIATASGGGGTPILPIVLQPLLDGIKSSASAGQGGI